MRRIDGKFRGRRGAVRRVQPCARVKETESGPSVTEVKKKRKKERIRDKESKPSTSAARRLRNLERRQLQRHPYM